MKTSMHHQPAHSYDAVVIGARAAGASTAMLLARAGLDVLVIDKAELPSDTTSTHSLVRGGVVQLNRWGLLDEVLASGAPPIRSVTFHRYDLEDEPPIALPVKDKAGVDLMLAPRRFELDRILASAAERAGATVLDRTPLRHLLYDAGRVVGVVVGGPEGQHAVTAPLVIGADGVRSPFARHVGAPVTRSHGPGGVCLYSYVNGVDWDGFEFHAASDIYAGVFPTHHDAACVWVTLPTRSAGDLLGAGAHRLSAWLERLRLDVPGLAERVDGGRIVEPLRGTVGLPDHVRRPHGPGWALVGDAGYHRDPVSGHGLTDAFRDAELLADATVLGLGGAVPLDVAMAAYEATRDHALAETFRLTVALGRFPAVPEFVGLMAEMARVLDQEARWLADGPRVDLDLDLDSVRTARAS